MNFVFLLLILVPSALAAYYFIAFEKLKDEHHKLKDEFQQFKDDKEAFSLEMQKSDSELAGKSKDAVTELPARSAFEDRLRQAITHGLRFNAIFAVMSIAVDGFKEIDQGDTSIRDELLAQISERMLGAIREADTLTRFAGSNFVVLLPQLSRPETAAYVASRLQEGLLEPFNFDDHQYNLTLSIGVAIYPLDGNDFEALLKKASSALNEAKRIGPNKCYFWHRETNAVSERENQIFSALRSPDLFNHLALRYSLQVKLIANQIIGFHAMPTLLHPVLGEISSSDLIRMAEHCGRATEIVCWTFKKAIEEIYSHLQGGDNVVKLIFSVTSWQVKNTHFVFQIAEIAKKVNYAKVQPVLEIIDSPTRAQYSLIQKGFSTLSEAGVHFAIQMVSIGNNLLEKFPYVTFDYLKLNIGLVSSIIEKQEGKTILSSIISVTKNTNMQVIVDGVNSEKQKQYLTGLGIDILEGEVFASLMPGKQEEIS